MQGPALHDATAAVMQVVAGAVMQVVAGAVMQVVAGAGNGICIGDLHLRIAPLEALIIICTSTALLSVECKLPLSAPICPFLPLSAPLCYLRRRACSVPLAAAAAAHVAP